MQAFLNYTSWIGPSAHDRSPDKMACTKPRPVPVVEIPLLNKFKRDRSSSSLDASSQDPVVTKKQKLSKSDQSPATPKTAQATAKLAVEKRASLNASKSNAKSSPSPKGAQSLRRDVQAKNITVPSTITDPEQRAKLQEKIESQFNLEILLKHNELRLIEQELAKCQIALEQLRRCEAIPYPGEPGSSILPEQLSTGVGPALEPPLGFTRPQQPAPWGVVDGPYSRHYAQWLIPDPEFDPMPFQFPGHLSTSKSFPAADTRSTRGTISDRRLASKSRSSASTTSSLQALSTNYATPKDKQGPLIVKRPSDNQMVKLVCDQCVTPRDNFSSVQGFLNHCRIAHGRSFDSHGAAAETCGVPIDAKEPVATETAAAPESAASTPYSAHTGRPLVHPFITSTTNDRVVVSESPPVTSTTSKPVASIPTPQSASFQFSREMKSGRFVPSAQTPHLSALLKKHGLGADFNKMVDRAKEQTDMELIEPLEDDDEEDQENGDAMEIDVSAPKASAPKANSKPKAAVSGVRVPSSRARPTPLRTNMTHSVSGSRTSSARMSPESPEDDNRTDFSPHTMDTNPGLISDRDDEDYEDHMSRTSTSEDDWTEQDHSVKVLQHHHRGDERITGILDDGTDLHMSEAGTCAVVTSPMPAVPPKRKRGRPSKKGNKKK